MLAYRLKLLNRLLANYRGKVISEEIKIAKVSSESKVLFIGCGLFPTTPIIISKETNAHVTAIEHSSKIVHIAKSYINKNGLSNKIKIEIGNGINYPVEQFDVIFIAINVWPIASVLKHLSSNMKTDSKLICRDIKNDIQKILKHEGLSDILPIKTSFTHPSGSKHKSLLIVKK
jgi:protein-L-isoaspartate O-methyltransferase